MKSGNSCKFKWKVFLFMLSVTVTIRCIKASSSDETFKEEDRIKSLPGQPREPEITQYSGYVTVNQQNGRALFYWFFHALSQASSKPLLLWLNGGPGCSSIGYGAAVELGPLKVTENGVALSFNNFSWIQEANVIFVESPVGVGFSYANTSSDLSNLGDHFVAEDAYNFLVNWLERYPEFKSHDFFIAGESYGGHYVPQLAELIFDRNKDKGNSSKINLKGFIVGNPETDDLYDTKGLIEYAWSHAVIGDDEYNTAKQACHDFMSSNSSNQCNSAMNLVFQKYHDIDIYNIYAPICLLNSSSTSSLSPSPNFKDERGITRRQRIWSGGYDPCYSNYAEEYFNRVDVQSSFHSNINRPNNSNFRWKVCSDPVFNTYNFSVESVLPIYKKLILGGLQIWIYSGDADGRVPVIGSRYWVESLGLPVKSPWRSWFHNHQVGGRVVKYEGLTLVTVRGAGHLVPLNKPSEALALIHSFLSREDLPSQR